MKLAIALVSLLLAQPWCRVIEPLDRDGAQALAQVAIDDSPISQHIRSAHVVNAQSFVDASGPHIAVLLNQPPQLVLLKANESGRAELQAAVDIKLEGASLSGPFAIVDSSDGSALLYATRDVDAGAAKESVYMLKLNGSVATRMWRGDTGSSCAYIGRSDVAGKHFAVMAVVNEASTADSATPASYSIDVLRLQGTEPPASIAQVSAAASKRISACILEDRAKGGEPVLGMVLCHGANPQTPRALDLVRVGLTSGTVRVSPLPKLCGEVAREEAAPTMTNVGDRDGDGMSDVSIAASLYPNAGYAAIVSTQNVQVLCCLAAPQAESVVSRFPHNVRSTIDFNGDGVADLIAADPSAVLNGIAVGSLYVFCGKTGRMLKSIEGGVEYGELGRVFETWPAAGSKPATIGLSSMGGLLYPVMTVAK